MANHRTTEVSSDEYFSKYDGFISETIEHCHVPGVSIAVIDGAATYCKGYGIARYPDEGVSPTTLFNVGSMTKAFVASAASLLVDDEEFPEVRWATPVSRLLRDDFVLSDSRYTEMVTLEDILSHRSGLPDMDDACMGIYAKNPDTIKSVTRKLRYLPLSAPLRTKFQYCNIMYAVATHLVETLSGRWMGDFLREKFWEPLKMNSTYWGLDDVKDHGALDQFTKGYHWDEDEAEYVEVPWPVQPEAAGAGEIISTGNDYAAFLRCMIDKCLPISPEGHKELIKPRTIDDDDPKPFHSQGLYALGWEVQTYHGEKVISHGGSTSGFGSNMLYLPRLKWGIVILGNGNDSYLANYKICWTLIDDLLGLPAEKRTDWGEFEKEEEKEEEEEEANQTIEHLYPKIPDPPLSLALPLESYTGTYRDEGFETFVVEIKNGLLFVDGTTRTWRFHMTLKHVSGEYFVAEKMDIDNHYEQLLKAAFRISVDGTVEEFGVDLVEELGGELIWFRRV